MLGTEEPSQGLIHRIMVGNLLFPNPSANFGSILRKECIVMKTKFLRFSLLCVIVLLISLQVTTVFAHASQFPTLRVGSRGENVVRLQRELISRGILKDTADGIFGPKTEKAVRDFQSSNGLAVDGIAGPKTHAKLFPQVVSRGTSSVTTSSNSSDDLYWLSRIIHAEAGGESYRGKVAVGNVVLNRVKSNQFPNGVKEVIFERYKGIPQFCPVDNGAIYKTPNQDSINAAKEALKGVNHVGDSTYFFNPDKATGTWIVRNKSYVMRIGNHVFYR